jgi:hypothetical protein
MTDHDTIEELDEEVRAELVAALTRAVQIIDHHTLQEIRLVEREDGSKYWEPLNRAAKAFDAIEALLWEIS